MKESQFRKIFFKNLEDYRKYEKISNELNDLGIDIFESPLSEIYYMCFDRVNDLLFNDEGIDWFNWYIFDKPKDCNTFEYNGMTILIDTDEKMYNFLKQFSNFTFNEDYFNNEGC